MAIIYNYITLFNGYQFPHVTSCTFTDDHLSAAIKQGEKQRGRKPSAAFCLSLMNIK